MMDPLVHLCGKQKPNYIGQRHSLLYDLIKYGYTNRNHDNISKEKYHDLNNNMIVEYVIMFIDVVV